MQSDSEIKIQGKKIIYKSFNVDFELQEGFNEEKKHRFFHIRLKAASESVEEFARLGRAIKKVLGLASGVSVQVLWDDISFHYSNNSYPLIHEIENLMRKLITKFMLTNVGLGWAKETIPEEVKKSSRAGLADGNNNYLYEVDFIQLSDFLFNEYRTLDLNALVKVISEIGTDTISVREISDFIPKSNWKRYFEPYVDCDAGYLQSRWQKLYELRCKIAHNNSFNKSEYEQTEKLANEVKEKLLKAIESLDAISVPEDDREELAESVAVHVSSGYATFIHKWRMVEGVSIDILKKVGVMPSKAYIKGVVSTYSVFNNLIQRGLITAAVYNKIRQLQKIRNIIVHEGGRPFTATELTLLIKDIDELIEELYKCSLSVESPPDVSGGQGDEENN
ncbi:hypothetical protein thsps117_10970 [Pseudomonas sp. No.117]